MPYNKETVLVETKCVPDKYMVSSVEEKNWYCCCVFALVQIAFVRKKIFLAPL